VPGIHPKLPDGAQDEVGTLYEHAEEHRVDLNLYIKGEGGDEDEEQQVGPAEETQEEKPA
jgi:hypothetical protein